MHNSPGEFDKGWFRCYKFILYMYAVFEVLLIISNIARLSSLGSEFSIIIISILAPLIFLVFLIMEILAMKNRDFQKAKIALYGFAGYIVLYIIFFIIILASNRHDPGLVVQMILSLALFFVFILWGAIQVYKALGGAVPATTNVYTAYNNA